MIHIPLLVPLLLAGFTRAAWREHRRGKVQVLPAAVPSTILHTDVPPMSLLPPEQDNFDDVGELNHYQDVSWYALALAAAAWFYRPAMWVSMPLLGYNTYHFIKMIRQTDNAHQKTPLTLFESIALTASLFTGQGVNASLLFLFSFGSRKFLLHVGNIASIGLKQVGDPRFAKVWVLRDGAEIEMPLADVESGDIMVMRGGETILAKGKVIEGNGIIRQYSLQKKIKLIPKQPVDKVFPFTQLETGCLHIKRL